eukprot:gnl/TRDRNA2_/TRDRNA2_133529_c3_seq2.p1 gnl/TRDRNA2_/TRDRNA2_133529_c3~~gnl/TRDRNA2_/TRDRNA2_133529_c3_seq2.p1  ORF type:complete len:581 (-),score=88.09 gnl/TRDRNA2_/TRDRNA2_133529_c3_seq2:65-1570(-)
MEMKGPLCHCNPPLPTRVNIVRREGPNCNREFWTCVKEMSEPGRCCFFAWLDEPVPEAGPPCKCGGTSVMNAVRKDGPNSGRKFYSCAKQIGDPSKCDFFAWADGEPSRAPAGGAAGLGGSGAVGGGQCFNCGQVGHWSSACPLPRQSPGADGQPAQAAGPACRCGMPSIQRTVRKEGPNCGKQFYTCTKPQGQQCGFFEWLDAAGSTGGGGGGVLGGQVPGYSGYSGEPMGGGKGGSGGGECFNCGQLGHWSSACPLPRQSLGAEGQPAQSAGPACRCGMPSIQRTVRKEGPNCGKHFYTCAKPQGQQCGFFEWLDNTDGGSGGQSNAFSAGSSGAVGSSGGIPGPVASAPLCQCQLPCIQRTVAKEGPNFGRQFNKCPKPMGQQCGFFEWVGGNSEDGAGNAGGSSKGGGVAGGECFNCGQVGHWSSACPMPRQNRGGKGNAGGGGNSGMAAETDECFKCGQTGHWASMCPNDANAGGRGRGRGGKGYKGGAPSYSEPY